MVLSHLYNIVQQEMIFFTDETKNDKEYDFTDFKN